MTSDVRQGPGERLPLTSTHWGTYRVETVDGVVKRLHDFEHDPDPSPIGHGIVDVLDGPTRISGPMVRRSWLENGPGANTELRGREPFVSVSWEEVNRLVADEVARVRRDHGNSAIFGGSYGWSSAGRFHHAQSQLHRFLNSVGGYTRSVNTYSFAAAEVMVPHVLGDFRSFLYDGPTWADIIDHSELVVAFGGIPVNNGQISQGGLGRHTQRGDVRAAAEAGVRFVNVAPIRADVMAEADAHWVAARPGTDVALMLGLAHTLLVEDRHDRDFLDRFTTGFDHFARYLLGQDDGVVKSARWAAGLADVDEQSIIDLARDMARHRTVISTSWSLSRHDHGEQPYWAALTLAAMLGGIGLPGQGLCFGLSAVNGVGAGGVIMPVAPLPQLDNPVEDFTPVARIADMLLNPGTEFGYDGGRHRYPDIRLVWWAGGNPFHHHQDLGRLLEAWRRPDTIIANEWTWNANARHADIVLACTTSLERADIQITPRDPFVSAMEQAIEPVADARDDYEIFADLARLLSADQTFTEGRSAEQWLSHLYEESRRSCAEVGIELPTLAELRERQFHEVRAERPASRWARFRNGEPLTTPSGRLEIHSETVSGFGLADCGGHARWFEPREWLGGTDGRHPLQLLSNQPRTKLHSQLDHGSVSRAAKIGGREPIIMHPEAARTRGLAAGDQVRVYNDRGALLAGVVLDDGIRPDVVQLSTGAWFDPRPGDDGRVLCKHGNPNVLTRDQATSDLAQGPSAHSCLVQVEAQTGAGPPVTAYDPPEILFRP